MTTLRYKDYQGAVTFEDGRLVIQILHIDDFITTECDSASGAQAAFEELVDDYLATCAELKKQPSKPFKGSFNVRLSPALHKRAAMAAAEREESLNAFLIQALEAYLGSQPFTPQINPVVAEQILGDVTIAAVPASVHHIWGSKTFSSPGYARLWTTDLPEREKIQQRSMINRLLRARENVPWVSLDEDER
jgi:predicted HicB family RNase H-like nuclease